jgi:hypothetical protein
MKKNQYGKAYESLLRLRNHPLQAARDIYYIHSQLELEAEILGTNTYKTRFIELFTIPRLRRATVAAITVMLAQVRTFLESNATVHANPGTLANVRNKCDSFL